MSKITIENTSNKSPKKAVPETAGNEVIVRHLELRGFTSSAIRALVNDGKGVLRTIGPDGTVTEYWLDDDE